MDEQLTKIVYLDNNFTTLMSKPVLDTLLAWCNRGISSEEYVKESRQMMNNFRKTIAIECGFELVGPLAYEVIFTSGASESNCHIITSAVRSYAAKTKCLPHVITSASEHKSVLLCCKQLKMEKLCQLTILPVRNKNPGFGSVDCADLTSAIRTNTCLISIMSANHETGILNNIRALSKIAKSEKIPFHTDAVQLFGKSIVKPLSLGIDAFSASFHKLGGPPGVGILVIRRALIEGYNLCPYIYGSQNNGMRGGAENLSGIAASFTAFRTAMTDRAAKTSTVLQMKNALRQVIESRYKCFYINDHPEDEVKSIDGGITLPKKITHNGSLQALQALQNDTTVIFWIAPLEETCILPNTLVFAVRKVGFCSKTACAELNKRGIIISAIEITGITIPTALQSNILRISLSDDTTIDDIKLFAVHFIAIMQA
jgi:cysteine desulfurase